MEGWGKISYFLVTSVGEELGQHAVIKELMGTEI